MKPASHSEFTLSKKHDYYGKMPRVRIAQDAKEYRRWHKTFQLPALKTNAAHEQFLVETDYGKMWLIPVMLKVPSIGRNRIDMLWRASVEYIHPATRWNPEEGDEYPLCDSGSLISAVICGTNILRLKDIYQTLADNAMAQIPDPKYY